VVDERRLAVLRAIVEDFVLTSEPVGSKALAERHPLGVSPATIRNDMALLEEEGFIVQPHTSAGRVPTDKGYRLFVDRLATVRPMSAAERRAITSFLEQGVDLDDVLLRTVRLLSQLTRQVALVQYPRLIRSTVRHVDLVPLSSTRAVLVLITNTGRVEQRVINAPAPVSEDTMVRVRAELAARLDGRPLGDIRMCLADCEDAFTGDDRSFVTATTEALVDATAQEVEERVVMSGAANLTKYPEDFHSSVFPVLEALEEHVVLLRLLSERSSDQSITVRIGAENAVASMSEAAVMTAGYSTGDGEMGRIGLVGPTRMDYAANMSAVRAVARYLGRILAEQ
jgi:heat-inducible transcriptional repressor